MILVVTKSISLTAVVKTQMKAGLTLDKKEWSTDKKMFCSSIIRLFAARVPYISVIIVSQSYSMAGQHALSGRDMAKLGILKALLFEEKLTQYCQKTSVL